MDPVRQHDVDILDRCEMLKMDNDDEVESWNTEVFFNKNDYLHTAKSNIYNLSSSMQASESEFYEVKKVDNIDRGPRVQPSKTLADEPSDNYYLESLNYHYLLLNLSFLEEIVSREIEVYEILRQNPHPNLASYFGCLSTNGRVTGLCLERYTTTLGAKMDPGHHYKTKFLIHRDEVDVEQARGWLDGILSGVKYLHLLGFVHNNIMFKEDGTPVLIDFGSCCKIGQLLEKIGSTPEWYNEDVKTALEKNDLDVIQELETWLVGTSADDFLFKEDEGLYLIHKVSPQHGFCFREVMAAKDLFWMH